MKQMKGFGILIAVNDSIDVVMKDERFIEQVGERQEPTRYILDKSLNYDDLKDIYKIYIAIPEDKEEELTLRIYSGSYPLCTTLSYLST